MGLKKVGGGFFSTKMASLVVGCLWLLMLILDGPMFFWPDVITTPRSRHDCTMWGVDKDVLKIYSGIKHIITFFIPLAVTWISYCSIIYRTRKTLKTVTLSLVRYDTKR